MPPTDYALYLDESGQFARDSTDPRERAAGAEGFDSQLVGFLVRGVTGPLGGSAGDPTADAARQVLTDALAAAGANYAGFQEVHATDLLGRYDAAAVTARLAGRVRAEGWQPVRLVAWERVPYGNRTSNYTAAVAELILRICQQKWSEGERDLRLYVYPATVVVNKVALIPEAVRYRIREYLSFAAVRRGEADRAHRWVLDGLEFGSARKYPPLQVCDLLSNLSHDDYRRAGPAAGALREAFGAYDLTLTVRFTLERAREALAEGDLGRAVQALAEADPGDAPDPDVAALLAPAIDRLAGCPTPARDMHLRGLAAWAEQLLDGARNLDLGARVCRWLLGRVGQPLRERLGTGPDPDAADWFVYALQTARLTAANHRGEIREGREAADAVRKLAPAVAARWEHVPTLVRGQLARAVHLIDTFEYDLAAAGLRRLDRFHTDHVAPVYAGLSRLYRVSRPADGEAPRVRSDTHARVLGTLTQAETYAALTAPERAAVARDASERAVDEFVAQPDRDRQYQYRAHLEAVAGDWSAARRYLALALGLGDQDSWDALWDRLDAADEAALPAHLFPLMHLWRAGTHAAARDPEGEGAAFLARAARSRYVRFDWVKAGYVYYPVHAILRRTAHAFALLGEPAQAAQSLKSLRDDLNPLARGQTVLGAVQVAAAAEVVGRLATSHSGFARSLLDGPAGLLEQLEAFRKQTEVTFPAMWRVFEPAVAAAAALRGGAPGDHAAVLLERARLVDF